MWKLKKRNKLLNKPAVKIADQASYKHNGEIDNNPYLQSRRLWDDMYGNAQSRYQKSRQLNFMLTALVFLAILGVIYIGSQSKFVPYVVQMQNDQVIYSSVANSSNFAQIKPQLANFFLQQFVQSARGVSMDAYIANNNQKKSFAFTQGAATTQLASFYDENDPYSIVKKRTIAVDLDYINQLPNNDYQVGWTETSRNSQTGELLYKQSFIGQFDYTWNKPSQNTYILQNNPFGFYITNISWTGVK